MAAGATDAPGPPPGGRLAVYPGVFDPPTMAHLALIASALGIFDRLAVVVAVNPQEPAALFSPEERLPGGAGGGAGGPSCRRWKSSRCSRIQTSARRLRSRCSGSPFSA
jgi:cytidyltransferase-like protein